MIPRHLQHYLESSDSAIATHSVELTAAFILCRAKYSMHRAGAHDMPETFHDLGCFEAFATVRSVVDQMRKGLLIVLKCDRFDDFPGHCRL